MADDLTAPLGQGKKRKRSKLPRFLPHAVAGVLGLFVAVFAVWALVVDDPSGGDPVVVLATDPLPAPKKPDDAAAPANADAKPEPKAAAAKGEPPATIEAAKTPAAGTQTVTIIDGASGHRQEVVVPAQSVAAPVAAADPKLLETTRHGSIPRVSLDGGRAFTAYAVAVSDSPNKANLPRVALVISGLGIGSNNTAEAFAKLPAAVTFAFAPQGTDLERLAVRARGEGHEILLQLPMEPFDYPDNDPGPQTLLTTLAPEQNIDRMHWLMSRFQGYVGVTNYMGSRFTASESSFAPVLREVSLRGLMYLDDGNSPRSVAGQIAGANNLPYVRASVVLDAVPTPNEIDRALSRLEGLARDNGVAVGIASALPVSIARLARWAKTAEQHGFLLVPISAAAVKPKAS